jgi:sialic acid synthase SpsE
LIRPFEPEFERLLPLTLSPEIENWFVKTSTNYGIIPMTTVFTHEGVDRARNAGFRSIKIASYDCASMPLISRVLEFCDELVISTGATSWSKVVETSKLLKAQARVTDIAFLHAVTEYPNALEATRLLRMLALRTLGYEVGFSDHTSPLESNLNASALAILLGANVIERHFTVLNRALTKDGPVSVLPFELKKLSRMLIEKDQDALMEEVGEILKVGNVLTPLLSLEPSALELKNADYYKGRVASTYGSKIINSWEKWPA